MLRYVALLRAINVGGARTVTMDKLRRALEPLGFSGLETLIASGNVIFETPVRSATRLESMIEKRLQRAFGYDIAVFVRTPAQLAAIAAYKAFPASKMKGTSLNIVFLPAPANARAKQKIKSYQSTTDEFRFHGREIYWLRRKRRGAVPYSTIPLDKALDKPFTIRSFNTVKKLAGKFSTSGS